MAGLAVVVAGLLASLNALNVGRLAPLVVVVADVVSAALEGIGVDAAPNEKVACV